MLDFQSHWYISVNRYSILLCTDIHKLLSFKMLLKTTWGQHKQMGNKSLVSIYLYLVLRVNSSGPWHVGLLCTLIVSLAVYSHISVSKTYILQLYATSFICFLLSFHGRKVLLASTCKLYSLQTVNGCMCAAYRAQRSQHQEREARRAAEKRTFKSICYLEAFTTAIEIIITE